MHVYSDIHNGIELDRDDEGITLDSLQDVRDLVVETLLDAVRARAVAGSSFTVTARTGEAVICSVTMALHGKRDDAALGQAIRAVNRQR